MSAFADIGKKRREYEQEIHETCALARKPEKAAGFIARVGSLVRSVARS
jgi:hypothetical protein